MKPIDKFILHIIHNWDNALNEAYAPAVMTKLIEKFKEEAEDLNINITDEQLKKYIERFDTIKNSSNIPEKDLFKYSLSKLIKLVTSAKGIEDTPDAADITPDVVYNENGLIIYNGSNQNNCINYGRGESWCITKSSFGTYRYDKAKKNPTFYLVKDNNIQLRPDDKNSEDYRKSFFVVVVGSDNTYKISDRSNNDVGGQGTEWNKWEPWSFVEQKFPSIRGLQNIFKYIPLSTSEKLTNEYVKTPTTVREWSKMPFKTKEQYLVVRKDKELFSDISNEIFVDKVLPKFPQIANFVATNAGIINNELLLKHLDKFSNSDTRSIFANMRDRVPTSLLNNDTVLFETKKLITKLDKWKLENDEAIYITNDGNAIVKLKIGDDISMNLYTEDDDYNNVKLNKRTSKYLMDYPGLEQIPLKTLLQLSIDGALPSDFIERLINNAEGNEESSLITQDTEDGKYVIDAKSLAAYKINNNQLTSVPFNSEEVQNIINTSGKDEVIQDIILNIFKQAEDIPVSLDRSGVISVLTTIPDNRKTININGRVYTLLITDEEEPKIFYAPSNINTPSDLFMYPIGWGFSNNWRGVKRYNLLNPEITKAYFRYLNDRGIIISWERLKIALQNSNIDRSLKKAVLLDPNLPLDPQDGMVPIEYQDTVYIINRRSPANSAKLSPQSGKLIKANIPATAVRRLLGAQPGEPLPAVNNPNRVADPIDNTTRRGRPAGVANTPREAQPRAQGNVNVQQEFIDRELGNGFTNLPRNDLRKLAVNNAVAVPRAGDRGASARDNMLAGRGRVINVVSVGPSKIYFITLQNGTRVASINIQPGNRNYVVTDNRAFSLNSPRELVDFLQNRNILEELRTSLFKVHLQENPYMIDEIKQLKNNPIMQESYNAEESFKDYSNDALTDMIINLSRFEGNEDTISRVKAELARRKQYNNKNMKISEFKNMVRESVRKKLAETVPSPAPTAPDRETITRPDREEQEKKRRRIGNPNVDPKPKNINENEKDIIDKIIDRYKQTKNNK
jgi:hypothetical protein